MQNRDMFGKQLEGKPLRETFGKRKQGEMCSIFVYPVHRTINEATENRQC